ncbi:STAS domain-containing protein [Paenibacillus tarimensis]|uniref:STAS domain-containing protein n=1 Tax=Paenibacillus tarimensis TaxID=416012 RepID=UPI001F18ECDF|nr:STAS domain-containing protein [Paenibacillus tarimensis]MCF2942755.1 STAS domain-containing protein [Paenibacillus tarimensis]
MFTYQLDTKEDMVTLSCEGDIDIDASEVFEDGIQPVVSGYSTIIFDFEQIYFVDSSGIGLIIKLVNELQEAGKTVRIERIRPEVMEVFELLQIDEILGKDTFL